MTYSRGVVLYKNGICSGRLFCRSWAERYPVSRGCQVILHSLDSLQAMWLWSLARHLAAHRKQQAQASSVVQVPIWLSKRATRLSPKVERLQQSRREERLACYEQVVALRRQG